MEKGQRRPSKSKPRTARHREISKSQSNEELCYVRNRAAANQHPGRELHVVEIRVNNVAVEITSTLLTFNSMCQTRANTLIGHGLQTCWHIMLLIMDSITGPPSSFFSNSDLLLTFISTFPSVSPGPRRRSSQCKPSSFYWRVCECADRYQHISITFTAETRGVHVVLIGPLKGNYQSTLIFHRLAQIAFERCKVFQTAIRQIVILNRHLTLDMKGVVF